MDDGGEQIPKPGSIWLVEGYLLATGLTWLALLAWMVSTFLSATGPNSQVDVPSVLFMAWMLVLVGLHLGGLVVSLARARFGRGVVVGVMLSGVLTNVAVVVATAVSTHDALAPSGGGSGEVFVALMAGVFGATFLFFAIPGTLLSLYMLLSTAARRWYS